MPKFFGKFQIKNNRAGEFYFVLKAKNGETIARSESYSSKQGAKRGIRSVRYTSTFASIEDLTEK